MNPVGEKIQQARVRDMQFNTHARARAIRAVVAAQWAAACAVLLVDEDADDESPTFTEQIADVVLHGEFPGHLENLCDAVSRTMGIPTAEQIVDDQGWPAV